MGKILFVLVLFAGVVYAFFWLLERRRRTSSPTGPTAAPKRVVAPDDDEDFLRELERRRRRQARETKPEKPAPRPEQRPTDSGRKGDSKGGSEPEQPKPDGPADKRRSKPE